MGNTFNIALVHCTQLISCSFVYGCRRCEMKGELVSPWSYVCVLEKRLGRWSNPCLIMVETCRVTIMSNLWSILLIKKEIEIEKKIKREKEKKRWQKRKERKKHHFPMVNKKMLRCLLSACLVNLIWGFFHIIRQGVPRCTYYDKNLPVTKLE